MENCDAEARKLAAKLLGAAGGRKSRNTIPPEQQARMQAAKKEKYKQDPRKGKKIGHMFNCQNPRCRGGCNKRKFGEGV